MTMYQQRKPRDYRSLWLISMAIIAIGVVLTINLAMIRPLGYVLLGVGGIGLVLSLSRMKDRQDQDNRRHFN